MRNCILTFASSVILLCLLAACGGEKEQTPKKQTLPFYEPEPPVWNLSSNEKELGTSDFMTFDIDRDYTELNERLFTDTTKDCYVENTDFNKVVKIKFNGEKAYVESEDDEDAYTVQTSGAHVTIKALKRVECVLSGKSDNGSINIEGDKKVRITLNGLELSNTNGPAIRSLSKKECYIVTDTASVLRDDSLYAEKDTADQKKGCVFAEGKIAFSGTAKLQIIAKGADAIHSDKSIFIRRGANLDIEAYGGDAIQAQHNIRIEGGMVNILSTHAGSRGLQADSIISITGGRTVIVSKAPGHSKNMKNSRCINCDSIISITGGIVRVKESSLGGKGIRSGKDIFIKTAIVDVLTFGNWDRQTGSKNKGIKAAHDVHIDSARVRVRCVGIMNEGLEAKNHIYMSGSLVEVKAGDDGVNAGIDDGTTPGDIIMNGGRLYAISDMDAIDSNGEIHINDGLVFSISNGKGSRAFDCDYNEFYIGPEAIVVGIGGSISPFTAKILKHPTCEVAIPHARTELAVTPSGSQENLISFERPNFKFNGIPYKAQISVPKFKENISFDFCNRVTVDPAHTFHGLAIGGTISGKKDVHQTKLSNNYSKVQL